MISTSKAARWPDSMNVTVELAGRQVGSNAPDLARFRDWIHCTLSLGADGHKPLAKPVISVRLVNEEESAELNSRYRNRQGATNVLSFPARLPADMQALLEETPLGDLAICMPVVEREADEQNKPILAHWAHMTVHGTLHLLGHDHQNSTDAECMEKLECRILESLGFDNPYQLT